MYGPRHMDLHAQLWLWDPALGKWKNSLVLGPVSVPQSEDDISGKQLQLDF